jgi:hypothetical protein
MRRQLWPHSEQDKPFPMARTADSTQLADKHDQFRRWVSAFVQYAG